MAARREPTVTTPVSEVKEIRTDQLDPNPHNPRKLFDDIPMTVLRESIVKNGILVPLTVYLDGKRNSYVILDGERRWRCANELGLNFVPVNIVREPTLVENIVTMFQIHQHREDWQLMPTALKLNVLMIQLDDKNERRLAEITGLPAAIVSRCKKLLTFSPKYQDMMLDANPSDRIKADFFIELYPVINDKVINQFNWFKPGKFTDVMLDRYQRKTGQIVSVTDFRKIKQSIAVAKESNNLLELGIVLKEFYEDENLGVDHVEVLGARIHKSANQIRRSALELHNSLVEVKPASYFGEKEMWDALENLAMLISSKLKKADRRTK